MGGRILDMLNTRLNTTKLASARQAIPPSSSKLILLLLVYLLLQPTRLVIIEDEVEKDVRLDQGIGEQSTDGANVAVRRRD